MSDDFWSGKPTKETGGDPNYMFQNIPDWMKDKYTTGLQNMPSTIDIQYGGGNYPVWYKPFTDATSSLYKTSGFTPVKKEYGQMSGSSSTLASLATWLTALLGAGPSVPAIRIVSGPEAEAVFIPSAQSGKPSVTVSG